MVHPLVLPMALLAKSSMVSQTSRCAWRSSSSSTALASSSKKLYFPVVDPSGGNSVNEDSLFRDKRVALYFAAGWCPMCTRAFEPSLETFRQACDESNKPVEFLYVSSDKDPETATQRAVQLNMKMVSFQDSAKLKKEYNIWAGSESLQFGFGRRSGVPAIVVLDKTGEEMSFLPAEAEGPKALASWPIDDERGIWGA